MLVRQLHCLWPRFSTNYKSVLVLRNGLRMGCGMSTDRGSANNGNGNYPLVCDGSVMNQKRHGSCEHAVMAKLRWKCDYEKADRICCYNRHYAEESGYFENTAYLKEVDRSGETTYYDSVSGKPLFIAPRGRSFSAFLKESLAHGWPSFRDEEVVWENMRCLKNGESVSLDGTHLGHNLPDRKGNRYCINLVSVAGMPPAAVVNTPSSDAAAVEEQLTSTK